MDSAQKVALALVITAGVDLIVLSTFLAQEVLSSALDMASA
jgi:hypothetical protein